jgi:hypothetical protein
MAENKLPAEGADIGLAEMIESLRSELQVSLEAGSKKGVQFDLEKVELELKVAVSRKGRAEAGIAFWVVKAGANVEGGRDAAHTFKLTLMPVDAATGTRLRVASATLQAPSGD